MAGLRSELVLWLREKGLVALRASDGTAGEGFAYERGRLDAFAEILSLLGETLGQPDSEKIRSRFGPPREIRVHVDTRAESEQTQTAEERLWRIDALLDLSDTWTLEQAEPGELIALRQTREAWLKIREALAFHRESDPYAEARRIPRP